MINKISVLFYKDKWNDGLVRAEDGTIESAALELLSKRVKDGFWYEEHASVWVGLAALIFLGRGVR